MLAHARSSLPPASHQELRLLMYEVEAAKNRFSNRSGFSPAQRQIGQWPRVPSLLMSDELIDPALQSQNNTEDYLKQMQMREIAQEAFVAQKALKARPRVQRDWKPGDLVHVYRVMRQR